uniref:Uncharacterized protein n=1 Tax=Janibacter limosus TaxID=53458 RepID=A0AC61U257_9MICO|nr:hypothetical protein [Janibacter limosus]
MPVSGPQAARMQPPAGHGALMLTMQGSRVSAGLTPTVRIDGYPVPASFGPNFYPLRPGQHRVDVHAQWMRQYGRAAMGLDIREGQTVPGFYAVPWHQFTTGSMGHGKQSRKGLGVMIAIVAIVILIICGCSLGSILLS